MKNVLSVVMVGLLLGTSDLGAQEAKTRRVGLGLTGGFSTVPSPFVSQCPSPSDNAFGLNFAPSLFLRPWQWIVLQVDGSVTLPTMGGDCVLLLPLQYIDFDKRDIRDPVLLSTVRIGLETPEHLPLFRATIGTGRVWGTPYRPLTVWGVAAGGRGKGARFLMEWEQYRSRVNAEKVREGMNRETSRTPIVARLRWSTLRFGVEVPIGR